MASIISTLFAIFLTGLVLAPWYVNQMLSFLSGKGIEPAPLILIGATIAVILLLVSGIGRQRNWLKWGVFVGLIVLLTWVGSVIKAFTSVEPDISRFGPGLIFAITSLWLPFLAWSLFFDLTWMARFAVLLVLLLTQPLFVVRYRVQQINEFGDMTVVKRSLPHAKNEPKPKQIATAPKNASGNGSGPTHRSNSASPKTNTSPNAVSMNEWFIGKSDGADAQLLPGLAPNSLLVEIKDKARDELWKLQLIHPRYSVQAGKEVKVSFRARAPKPRPIQVEVSQNHEPWKRLGIFQTIELKPEWQDFSFEGLVPVTENDARLLFGVGGHNTSVEIADIKLISGQPKTSRPEETHPVVAAAPVPAVVAPKQQPIISEPVETEPIPNPPQIREEAPHSNRNPFEGWSIAIEADSKSQLAAKKSSPSIWSITIGANGSASEREVRLENDAFQLKKGKKYELHIRAKSNIARSISASITQPESSLSTMGLSQQFELSSEWKEFVGRFEAIGNGPSKVQVNIGGIDSVIDIEKIELAPLD